MSDKYNLVIVESPNKINSIKKYLQDYEVEATNGHVVYLPSTGKDNFGFDIETWIPRYKIDPSKKNVFKKLKSKIKNAQTIFIATDPDREGEAIASNLVEFLKIENNYYRIRFNEITEKAIKQAIQNPGKIDEHLVDSQVARRLLDRVIGYKLSQLMRRKITGAISSPSAGRVQSIALKLVVERQKEIDDFVPQQYFTLDANLGNDLIAKFYTTNNQNTDPTHFNQKEIEDVLEKVKPKLTVKKITKTLKNETKVSPFKQATLYKKANNALKLSVNIIQSATQRLYEGYGDGGLISYPRTDSTRISNVFLKEAFAYISQKYGKEYIDLKIKGFAGAQDAHEAIRPTNIQLTPQIAQQKFNLSPNEFKLYRLIYENTLQALMKVPTRETIRFDLYNQEFNFKISFSKIIFDGYYKIIDLKEKVLIPTWKENDVIDVKQFLKNEHLTKGPSYFNDGSLIETLDKIGVGRPSTFAPTINVLKKRQYVLVEKRALKATDFGKIVYNKLIVGFPHIMNEGYTAEVETNLDQIAEGQYGRKKLLDSFWKKFVDDLSTAIIKLDVTQLLPVMANKDCPKCGKPLIVRINRKDKTRFWGCSNFPNCRHTEVDPSQKRSFFSRRKNQKK